MKLLIADARNAEKFVQLFSQLKGLSETITLHFEDERLYCQGFDMSQVSMYEISLTKEWFEDYDCDEGDAHELSISIEIISKVLSMRQKNQMICIEYHGDPDKLDVSFKNLVPTEKEFPKEFQLPLMQIDYQMLEIPDVEYEVDFGIKTKKLAVMISQLQNFDDNVAMKFSETTIRFTTSSQTMGTMSVDLFSDKVEYVDDFSISEGKEINISFSTRYFVSFCQFDKLAVDVELHFSENYPMQMKYELEEDSYVRFMLAPKIED